MGEIPSYLTPESDGGWWESKIANPKQLEAVW